MIFLSVVGSYNEIKKDVEDYDIGRQVRISQDLNRKLQKNLRRKENAILKDKINSSK